VRREQEESGGEGKVVKDGEGMHAGGNATKKEAGDGDKVSGELLGWLKGEKGSQK
jgi:hypothetical protein